MATLRLWLYLIFQPLPDLHQIISDPLNGLWIGQARRFSIIGIFYESAATLASPAPPPSSPWPSAWLPRHPSSWPTPGGHCASCRLRARKAYTIRCLGALLAFPHGYVPNLAWRPMASVCARAAQLLLSLVVVASLWELLASAVAFCRAPASLAATR
jgi:hypothetical protein